MRYALALFNIAKEDNKINLYQKEIKEIKEILLSNVELVNLLKSEFIDINERYKTVNTIFKKYSLIIKNFIKVLIYNHRINNYLTIFNSFNTLCNEANHVLEGIIYSTYQLDKKDIKQIETGLGNKMKVEVELTNKIDASLIGGIKVVINNHVYDYSIANEMNMMKRKLSV